MNNIWHFLREFESKDLVKKHIKSKFDYNLNTGKALEITSAFSQGREYFSSSLNADISVKPLLQYYGIVSISRALILLLNKNARENNIIPSHGLKIINMPEIVKSGRIENIILKSQKGTFTELIDITQNITYLRAGSSGINWSIQYDVSKNEVEFSFRELALCFPDLNFSVESWLGEKTPSKLLSKLKVIEDKLEIEIRGGNETELLAKIFPDNFYQGLTISEDNEKCIITFNNEQYPNLSQKWVSSFQTIGDPYIIPPFKTGIFLNDISKMYSVSYILGSISRYYPSLWNNITKGISNDSVLPFAINLMDFLQDKYPRIIWDFINSPYDFEKE